MLIGVAADSGCGKSTFMRRLVQNFGGGNVGPLGGGFGTPGGWETNTLVSPDVTVSLSAQESACVAICRRLPCARCGLQVICLDDYHANDCNGRKVTKRTALDAAENNFDLM